MKDIQLVIETITETVNAAPDKLAAIEAIKGALNALSPQAAHPVDRVRWIPLNLVEANDYNPNTVARKEMGLLCTSIKHDGYTQPVVTIFDPDRGRFTIVDGFHRYFVCRSQADIQASTNGLLPVVVIDKPVNERMASTVRHNRARGEHTVDGMSKLVFKMLDNGWGDAEICNELGLEPEELLKLKHITGFSALFKDVEYGRAWESKRMVRARLEYERKHGAQAFTGTTSN